jgi:hypothetical protein
MNEKKYVSDSVFINCYLPVVKDDSITYFLDQNVDWILRFLFVCHLQYFFTSGVHFFFLKVGIEESIVNAPLVSLQSENTNNTKSEVRFNS